MDDSTRAGGGLRACALLIAALVAGPAPAGAQSLLDRTDNVTGGWVGQSGQIYFNFIHRFVASPEPERKVSNFPTFTFGAGLPARTLLGFNYSTNSLLAPGYPNEWEFFARNRPFAVASGAPLDLSLQVGYNLASDGVDGELSVGRALGPVHPMAAFRVLADPFEAGATQLAVAGGAVVRLHELLSVAGDVGRILDEADARLAWSAGVRLALPYTPHTLSLHASNTNAATLQGMSRGERTRWGFEFTVPLTAARWRAAMAAAEPVPPPPAEVRVDTVFVTDTVVVVDTVLVHAAAPAPRDSTRATPRDTEASHPASRPTRSDSARATQAAPRPRPQQAPAATVRTVEIRNLAYAQARVEVARGTIVEWVNRDQVAHTASARNGSFDSGMIDPGARFRRTFDAAGTYEIFCRPHPFMRMTVVVR